MVAVLGAEEAPGRKVGDDRKGLVPLPSSVLKLANPPPPRARFACLA